jgi:hypothetical protein
MSNDFIYPLVDDYGYYWYDMSGFAGELGPCFICNRLVDRIDIDYHGNFCNSKECNDFIEEDLNRINSASED